MMDTPPENWQVFMEQYPQMMSLVRQLAKQAWYVTDGWTSFIGLYHSGIYLQVFKPHWFNQTGDGIHLEMALNRETITNGMTGIDLHVTHKNLFDREKFNACTVPGMEALAATWQGDVWFKPHTLTERLGMRVRFTKTSFPKQMADAFTRLSALGPIIDDGLAQL